MPYLFDAPDLLRALNRHYVLFFEPPWGLVFRHTWCRAFTTMKDPCLFGMGDAQDRQFLDSQPHIETTALAHGDFIEDIQPPPESGPKRYDIIFNASFDDQIRKRHSLMLSLLAHPALRSKRALLIGRGAAQNVAAVEAALKDRNLAQRVRVVSNLPRHEVPGYLAQAHVGVLLSLHENGGRAVYELFRADLPCVLSACTAGVNQEIFTPQTGLCVADEKLAEAIDWTIRHRAQFSPRRWFVQQSGAVNASRQLNRRLRRLFHKCGYTWSKDIVAMTGGGSLRYLNRGDYVRLRSDFEALHALVTPYASWPIAPAEF